MKIGKIKLNNNLFLAPMVDVTDLPYRLICRRCGVGMAYTEMIYVSAILHNTENKKFSGPQEFKSLKNSRGNLKTKMMLKTCVADSPVGLQITGNNIEEFEEFVKLKKVWEKFDLIDLNCGCPSSRIVGNSAGSFLLKDPKKIGEIVRVLKKTGKPVSVKIRLGFKRNNVLEVAKVVEDAGAVALTVHCRLASWGNDKKADWSWLTKVREVVKIPLVGNGNVFSKEDYENVLKTGCDGVMVGRGAIGDPLIFERILKGGKFDVRKNLKLFRNYLKLEERHFGDSFDMGRVKYVGGKFLKGFEGAAAYRADFSKLKTFKEMKKLLDRVWEMNLF